jgi:hypothetical protein
LSRLKVVFKSIRKRSSTLHSLRPDEIRMERQSDPQE